MTSPATESAVATSSTRAPLARSSARRAAFTQGAGEGDPTHGVVAQAARIHWELLEPRGSYARRVRPVLNAAVLLALLPPALVLSVAIALVNTIVFLDPRKVFYVQPRVGRRGRLFRLVKFRTMTEPRDSAFRSWGQGDKRRVTAFGRLLRNTHFDELPQLWNVLCGDMNMIGPRPEMLEVEEWACRHVPGFMERLAIRPGLTGRAQITQGYTGQDVDAYAEKLRINREYLRNLSLLADLDIVLRTAVWMLRGRGWSWNRGASAR